MQDSWERSPVIEVVPLMHSLADDDTFPWLEWCDEMRKALNLQPVDACLVHSPYDVMRLAWAAAFRIPSDDSSNRHLYDGWNSNVVELVLGLFPFMSGYSCAWLIDRLYRYMGRTDVRVKQIAADETCFIIDAPAVSSELFGRICGKITMGNSGEAETFCCWLRACALRPEKPRPLKLVLPVKCHLDEQMHCHFDEAAQRLCTSLAKQVRVRSIRVRYTPVIRNGLPAYVMNAFWKS